jgi:DNA-binding LacI/PurR family transcriptional regulator
VHIDGGDLPASAQRRRGYRQAMQRHGLGGEIRILPGDYTEESGATAARHILSEEPPPTGIFAANDRCAHGVLDTLTRARIDVPGDISVAGYDDSEIARLSFIDLTTVRQDAALMAERPSRPSPSASTTDGPRPGTSCSTPPWSSGEQPGRRVPGKALASQRAAR